MPAGVYQITCLASGKFYIGSSVDIDHRLKTHKQQLESGKHINRHLSNAWGKHKGHSFSFDHLLHCDNKDLLLYEQRAIDGLDPQFNIARQAGTTLGVKHTPEALEKLRLKQLGVPSPTKGTKRPQSAVDKTASAHRGMKRSPETCQRISAALTGKKHKHPRSPETRLKLSVAMRGGALSPRQVLEIRRRRDEGERRNALAKEFGVSPSMISLVASGHRYGWVQHD